MKMNRNEDSLAWVDSLYRQHSKRITLYLHRRFCKDGIYDPHAVDDLQQEVFEIVCMKPEQVREHDKALGWLIVTANYVYANYRRKQNKQRIQVPIDENIGNDSHLITQLEDGIPLSEKVRTLKESLQEDEYTLFEQVYVRGVDPEKLSKRLGITVNAARTRISRIKRKAQAILMDNADL